MSSRREFLTGRVIQRLVRHVGDQLADELIDSETRTPQAGPTVRLETQAMACPWFVILNPGNPQEVFAATDALGIVHEWEARLSVYREESEASSINRQAEGEPLAISPEMGTLLNWCLVLSTATEGAFDPTMGVLIQLWRRTRGEQRIPTLLEIEAALLHQGMQQISLNSIKCLNAPAEQMTVTRLSPQVALDFGAVGKGYTVDRAAELLRSSGVQDFLIHGGHSSVWAQGDHLEQGGWPVGLRNPLLTNERFATLLLKNQALGTSGSNIQYFRHKGKRYGHLLDPRTGWPADSLLSVSVLAPTAAEADALSTAFYVLGVEKSLAYCESHPELGAIFVPPPAGGTLLEPIVVNIPEEQLFWSSGGIVE